MENCDYGICSGICVMENSDYAGFVAQKSGLLVNIKNTVTKEGYNYASHINDLNICVEFALFLRIFFRDICEHPHFGNLCQSSTRKKGSTIFYETLVCCVYF